MSAGRTKVAIRDKMTHVTANNKGEAVQLAAHREIQAHRRDAQ